MTTLAKPPPTRIDALPIDFWKLGWQGQWDTDGQPVDANGHRLARNYVRIGESGGGLRLYPPRLMNNIARTARWSLYAKARYHRFWREQIQPVITAIHETGGVAFARNGDDADHFDIWRIRQETEYGLSYGRESISAVPDNSAVMEPLEVEAHRRLLGDLRYKNRKLGRTLTYLNNRVYSDIGGRMNITARALDWAMREKIRREIGEASPSGGPSIIRVHVGDIGEWLWHRYDRYGWRLISSPSDEVAEIHIEMRIPTGSP
jgi:hypothetical protein